MFCLASCLFCLPSLNLREVLCHELLILFLLFFYLSFSYLRLFLDILLFFLDLLLGRKLHFLLSDLGIHSTFSALDIFYAGFEFYSDQIFLLVRFFDYFIINLKKTHGFAHEVPLLSDGLEVDLPLFVNLFLCESEVIALFCQYLGKLLNNAIEIFSNLIVLFELPFFFRIDQLSGSVSEVLFFKLQISRDDISPL